MLQVRNNMKHPMLLCRWTRWPVEFCYTFIWSISWGFTE